MPQYRIPFFGTILVEAVTQSDAEGSAGTWTRSMKQATHGVAVERPTEGRICALDLWIHQEPVDVTESFAAYLEEHQVAQKDFDPDMEEACRRNYNVGTQSAWELFEWGERVKKRGAQGGE